MHLLDLSLFVVHLALQIAFSARVLLRPHREPAARLAWLLVIALLPVLGMVSYLFLGEVDIGKERRRRVREIVAGLPRLAPSREAHPSEGYGQLFRLGTSISGFPPVGGNSARFFTDSNETIRSLVADIDAAREHVHVSFYIWLGDGNGTRVVEAMERAAQRGVACRVLVDALGSRAMVASALWRRMGASGVRIATALPLHRRPGWRRGRMDLRNHRKNVVIDDAITYCGSQNCADPEFCVKPKFAPWVDVMLRVEGPVARQNQRLFVVDWMTDVDEDLRGLLEAPVTSGAAGFTAQVIGTGPATRRSAMPEMFEALAYAAREELLVTTPYFVPDDAMQAALCAAARRGVRTRLVFPARNDSWEVAAASRSRYLELLEAGAEIHEFHGGLLHAKTFTIDGRVALVGSANMDRRSFDLNYENNLLIEDAGLTAAVQTGQESFLARSTPVALADVRAWSASRRLWNNALAMLGPVL